MLDEKEARNLLESAVTDVSTVPPSIDELLARGRSSRNRRRALTAAGAVVIALLFVGVGTTTAGLLDDRATFSSQPLAASATPEQVVQAYVAALNARDKDTALSLVTPHHSEGLRRSQGGLFGDSGPFGLRRAKQITDLRLGIPDRQYPRAGEGSSADGWQQAVFLRATYQRDGNHKEWGYMLVRNTDTDRWTIVGEGPA